MWLSTCSAFVYHVQLPLFGACSTLVSLFLVQGAIRGALSAHSMATSFCAVFTRKPFLLNALKVHVWQVVRRLNLRLLSSVGKRLGIFSTLIFTNTRKYGGGTNNSGALIVQIFHGRFPAMQMFRILPPQAEVAVEEECLRWPCSTDKHKRKSDKVRKKVTKRR